MAKKDDNALAPSGGEVFHPPAICRDLMKLRSVAKEIGKIYRQMRRREIDCADGSKQVYVLRQLGDILTVLEFENRLDELETLMKGGPINGEYREI